MKNTSASKVFSAGSANKAWNAQLLKSSVSLADARNRKATYKKVFARYDEINEGVKAFSGAAEAPILSNQYFNATMASYVRSFAGFTCIERDMDQPTALLWFYDLIGVLDNREVLPNVGTENLGGINAVMVDPNTDASALNSAYEFSVGEKIIPGSVVLKLIHAATPDQPIEIHDDFKGNLVAPATVLAQGAVDYKLGKITVQLGNGFVVATGDKFYLAATKDAPGTPEFGAAIPANGYTNRFKLQQHNIIVTSKPDMLIAENNLLTIAASQRAMGVNPNEIAGAKITELYTKLINQRIVDSIIAGDNSTEYLIDSASWVNEFYDYQSRLDNFKAELINVDTLLAKRSVKGVVATAYLVGTELGNWFRKLTQDNLFVDNTDSTYINDLIGYYKGIPVLRHTAIDAINPKMGYAIHKTADGQLAPSMRGIFLPLTNTPVVGNYNNPTQTAAGIFYQEAAEPIVPELVQKFRVNSL